ncbi:MAG: hypothetical protein JWN40_5219 [Phycisphaerales bacterium]|nr:hypothetical protein [Phycisphaerales bacterium]
MRGLAITLILLSVVGWCGCVVGLVGAFLNRRPKAGYPFAWERLTATGRQWLILFYVAFVVAFAMCATGLSLLKKPW